MFNNANPPMRKPWWRATAGYYGLYGVPGYLDEQEAFVQGIVRNLPVQGASNQMMMNIISDYMRRSPRP